MIRKHKSQMPKPAPPSKKRAFTFFRGNQPYTILISGSVAWTNKDRVKEVISYLRNHIAIGLVITGKRKGCERMVRDICVTEVIKTIRYDISDPDRERGGSAVTWRNLRMLRRGPSLVVLFDEDMSPATRHLASESAAAGVSTLIVTE